MRGSGNIAPKRLAIKPTIPPIVTTHIEVGQPMARKTCGNGASAS
jgi:hypothetical protein